MKGIILAGGSRSRLYPFTNYINKQLLPVYDKPMIYYPLSIMMSCGVREICIISSPEFLSRYENLLGNGNQLGLDITYKIQYKPNGIAESFIIAEDFIGDSKRNMLILGDNIFHGLNNMSVTFNGGALIFAYQVKNPKEYGVVEFDKDDNVISIEEKPENPKSKFVIPGMYIYDEKVVEYTKKLKPSKRGELEIVDINNIYLKNNELTVLKLKKGSVWLDVSRPKSLLEGSLYIHTVQSRQGSYIGCIEEMAHKMNFINDVQLSKLIEKMPTSDYKDYLKSIL